MKGKVFIVSGILLLSLGIAAAGNAAEAPKGGQADAVSIQLDRKTRQIALVEKRRLGLGLEIRLSRQNVPQVLP